MMSNPVKGWEVIALRRKHRPQTHDYELPDYYCQESFDSKRLGVRLGVQMIKNSLQPL
jgi:hypothetical protein